MTDERPTVCVDLDGVLNTYDGWRGPDHYPPPRPGARDFLEQLFLRGYRVVILTTRDIDKTWTWLREHDMGLFVAYVTNEKPPAVAYIDDRAIRFRGDFEATLAELEGFRAHWEQPEGEG